MAFAEIRGSSLGSVIAENNSTKFYIRVVGHQNDMNTVNKDKAGVWINGVQSYKAISGRGIQIVKMDQNLNKIEQVAFDLYGNAGPAATSMISYVDNMPTGFILAMFTFDAVGNNTQIATAFKKWGASCWGYHFSGQRRYSWSGIYDSTTKNMIADAFGGMGNEFNPDFDYYIDTSADLGVTGLGSTIVQDPAEYTGWQTYKVKEYYPKSNLATEFPNLSPGEWVRMQCDFKQDQNAINDKVQCLLTFQFYDSNGSYLNAISILKTAGLDWSTNVIEQKIPDKATQFDIGFYHFPSTAKTGSVYVKNVVIQPISEPKKKGLKARLGKYSVPTNSYSEGTTSGATVAKFTKDEQLDAKEMLEMSGGAWIKVFEHRTLDSQFMFPDVGDSVLYSEIPYLYSNLKNIDDYRLSDGRYKFKLEYSEGALSWEQTSSIEAASVTGFKLIENNMTGTRAFYGLRKNGNNSRYNGSNDNTWYYAIGAINVFNGGIPGAFDKTATQEVRLYVWKES